MANTDNPNGFKPVFAHGSNLPPLVQGSVDTSTAVAAGDPLIWSSGYLDVAASSSAAIAGVAAQDVASTSAYTEILFYPADPDITFEGQCSGNMTQGIIGTAVDIEGSTGEFEINEGGSTEKVARIIAFAPDTETGTNARVWFKWVISSFEGAEGSEE